MHGIRFIVGRLRGSTAKAVQSVIFDGHEWSQLDARAWLDRNNFKLRLDRNGRWLRSRQRETSEFVPQSFRTVETGRREMVTMSSNPQRRRKRRTAKKRKLKKNARARPRSRAKKTVRTKVTSTKIVRTNARKKHRRTAAPRARASSSRFTIAFAPSAARVFAHIARLSKARRTEMRRALRRHPSGGVYVSLPSWHGSREQAQRLADRVRLVLAYAAGRRRSSFTSSAAPRVIAVP